MGTTGSGDSMTNVYKVALVGIDDYYPPLPALVRTDYHWNGWAVPYFTLDTVKVIATTINSTDLSEWHAVTIDDDGVWQMDKEWREDYDDPRGKQIYAVEIKGIPHYPVGGMNWCWHEVSEGEA